MWAGSLSHNNLMECGLGKDFATHRLEHELSAVYGVTHGAGLAAIWPSWARFVLKNHVERFQRFAVNVMGVENDFAHPDETAEKGIRAMEDFYSRIGMPTNLRELLGREVTSEELDIMADKCSRGGTVTVGAMEVLDRKAMREVYEMAAV
jgi:alcohol dehydrogenase YqhD (iron-dependent ADH family)